MRVELVELKLFNFKGIKNLSVDFRQRTKIYGKNESGKTTIFNAFLWLLWGKDSKNRKDYEIKPYGENGNVFHNLETTVEAILLIDGSKLTLKRVYKEKWTKKRGSLNEEFTGHTTDFYINDVPKKLKDYTDFIGNLLTEEEFHLLSNPLYFNEILNNKERRDLLVSLVDDVSSSEIIDVNKDFEKLDLDNYSIEEILSMAKGSLRKINDDLKEIPARIDELSNLKTEIDFTKLESQKESLKKSVDDIDLKLQDASKVSDSIKEISSAIKVLEDEKRKLLNEFERKKDEIRDSFLDQKREIERKIDTVKFEIENKTMLRVGRVGDIESFEERLGGCEYNLDNLRKKWVSRNLETYQGDFICPTCKQDLPKDKIIEIKENFNLNKSKDLKAIQKNAKKITLDKDKYKKALEGLRKDVERLNIEIENLIKKKREFSEKLDKFNENQMFDDIKKLSKPIRIDEIDREIKGYEDDLSKIASVDNSSLIDKKKGFMKKLDEINKSLANKGLNEDIERKIRAYEDEEKSLAKNYEKEEEIIYLCEEYIKTYVDMVSSKINNLFEYANFKLFESQINGAIKETAEATYDGVPYGALNNAATINVGLDIINTFSKKLDKYVPIFIDNAESINKILEVDSQTIELIVSSDEKLIIK